MIIGIAGTLGAGKGTVVEYLKEKGFQHYSVSGYLKSVLDERGLPADRPHLSAQADEFDAEYEGGVLEVIYNKMQSELGEDFILESIHRVSEAEYLRSVGAMILGVTAEPRVRYERTSKRQEGEKDNVTYEDFLESIAREEEGKGTGTPNIKAVLEGADVVLNNDSSLEELHKQIETFLKQHESNS